MRVRIERIVDRNAFASAQSAIGLHDRLAAAVREDRIAELVSQRDLRNFSKLDRA
jgi:hypothetical protein